MKKTIFETEDSVRLQAHYNNNGFPVIVIDQDDDFLVYVFSDDNEVKDFIKHLTELIAE